VPFREIWQLWKDVPLARASLEKTLGWLKDRRYGRNLCWHAFNSPAIRSKSSIKEKLGILEGRKLVALFTSSTDEIAGDVEWEGIYARQADWVSDVIEFVKRRSNVDLVIRLHPNLSRKFGLARADDELEFYENLSANLPSNVTLVTPESDINSYALIDETDVVLTYGSTIGVEMAMLGKPVILCGRAIYEDAACVVALNSRDSLAGLLDSALETSASREIRRGAFRFVYNYVFQFEQPFPLIRTNGVYDARRAYTSDASLVGGADESLDRICRFLIDGGPLFDAPTSDDLARTTADENSFFHELENTDDILPDVGYETWLRAATLGRTSAGCIRRIPFGIGDFIANQLRKLWLPALECVSPGRNQTRR
jgi:hypothetical protein